MAKFSREVSEHRRFSLRAAGSPVFETPVAEVLVKDACEQEGDTLLEKFRTPLLLASRGYQKARMAGGYDGD